MRLDVLHCMFHIIYTYNFFFYNLVRQWQNEGLPPDQNSTENVILVKNGGHWPLFIDPQGQTYKWICQMEGDKLNKVFASDPNYMKTVETAIQ